MAEAGHGNRGGERREQAADLPDSSQRRAALDPARSFIVQAPAGSGKTGLLVQRFLRLLATVDNPEEIVAITFTRKAAAEMRLRILQALASAREAEPAEPWSRQTRRLAAAALAHAEAQGWGLLENPRRLRVRTIDSLCQYLAGQMPLRSGFGSAPRVMEDAAPLYRAAARSALNELESDSGLGVALAALLRHLDNDLDALQVLLADMLARRDQWLPVLVDANPRGAVERALRDRVEKHLRTLKLRFPAARAEALARLARYAADHLGPGHAISACRDLRALPADAPAGLPAWNALADLLLTQKGEWRRSVTVANGFPPGPGDAAAAKQSMAELLDELRPDQELADLLRGLRTLPDPSYADEEWALIEALFTVLLGAATHLKLVFREQGRVDFSETALAALDALGTELEPSDLALRLDYGVRHLLVDEFQDTSQSQLGLLRGLTAGWLPGDGRTLFLVGDPMQSIYRFRKAEVGLFLDVWEGRLGHLPVEPLRLAVNFRSRGGLIDWYNDLFPRVFPPGADKFMGAVPYAPSLAPGSGGGGAEVTMHPFIGRDDRAEAARMLELIERARAEQPEGTIAVLARSKAHLDHFVQSLRSAGLSCQAVEIGALSRRPAVLDLLALTLALLHPADRANWLAVLHGPLCGLTLADLHALAGGDDGDRRLPLAAALADRTATGSLSADGRARATAAGKVLEAALDERGRLPLRDWVEGTWLTLGGPACLADDNAAEDVEMFLRLLQELDAEAGPLAVTPEQVREGVAALFAQPDPRGDERLQLMTIHKAKGLEFDTVILPGLGKPVQRDQRKLLYWQEAVGDRGEVDLLFGPVKSARSATEPRTSAYIRQLQAEMGRLESGRLLYVAATRAKRRLHLLGHATVTRDGELSVASGSLLEWLWPAVAGQWEARARDASAGTTTVEGPEDRGPKATVAEPPRWRLPAAWDCPAPPATVHAAREAAAAGYADVVYEWAGETARAVGSVVHAWLQRLARSPVARISDIAAFDAAARRMLCREGVPAADLEAAAHRVRAAVESTLSDGRGQWILSTRHQDARCEMPITAMIDGQLRHLVIDRTFVDSDGTRWVVDYKTGTHEGADLAGFLDEEQHRYREQLARYAAAFRSLENRPVRAALYYPLLRDGWREVPV